MDSQTVPQLKTLAKNLGLRGYSRLRKAELIKLINQNRPRGVVNFIDEDDTKPITQVSKRQPSPSPSPTRKRKRQPSPHPLEKKAEDGDLIDFVNVVPTSKIIKTRQPPSLFGRVPEINVPILKPTVVTTTPNELPNVIQKTTENVIDWGEWLKNADEAIGKHSSKAFDAAKNEIMSMFNKPRHIKPTFTQKAQALAGYTKSYEVGLTNRHNSTTEHPFSD